MKIKDLMKNIKNLPSKMIENKLDKLVRTNYHFANLNEKNKEIVMDLIKEYKKDIKEGIEINSEKIRRDTYSLYKKRLSLGLTREDLDDIKKILEAFRA